MLDNFFRAYRPQWVHRITTSKGVRHLGLPVAVTTTILQAGKEQGLHWRTFLSVTFGVRLLVALLIIGVFGGLLFEWMMDKAFPWLFGAER